MPESCRKNAVIPTAMSVFLQYFAAYNKKPVKVINSYGSMLNLVLFGGIRHERSEVSRSNATATRPKNPPGAKQPKYSKKEKSGEQVYLHKFQAGFDEAKPSAGTK